MLSIHKPNDQYPFKENDKIEIDSYVLYRDNRFTKQTINNRHDMTMSKYNNAGYGYQIFDKKTFSNVGSVWFLNQVTGDTTYIRVSRYQSTAHNHFIAVLSELNDLFNNAGYSFKLKTSIKYAQNILLKNFVGVESKKTTSKRGKNDRSKKSSSVDGISFDLSEKAATYKKYAKSGMVEA